VGQKRLGIVLTTENTESFGDETLIIISKLVQVCFSLMLEKEQE